MAKENNRPEPKYHGGLVEVEEPKPWDFIGKKSYSRRIVEEMKIFVPNYDEGELYRVVGPVAKLPQISKMNKTIMAVALAIFYRNNEDENKIAKRGHKVITKNDIVNVRRSLRKYEDLPVERLELGIRMDIARYLALIFDVYAGEITEGSIEIEQESSELSEN